jgi:colanic acid biosynthesis protein WcaH
VEIGNAIELLEASVKSPSGELPEEVFLFVSGITPLVNVDLLIKDDQRRTLLTWRDDGYYPAGWHVPGGIIRYKELASHRIHAVAANELGAEVTFKSAPLAINEIIHPSRRARGHFISHLYECKLVGSPNENLRHRHGIPKPGEWAWHDRCPANIISVHEVYRAFM